MNGGVNGVVDVVRQRISDGRCLVDDVGKGGCGVSLTGVPPARAVVDLDAPGAPLGPARVRCDYLFFADPNLVAPIEIKDSEPDVVRAARQLQAGADAADDLLPRDREIVCRPVLVSRSLRRRKQIDLRQAVVRFRGRGERVRRVVCGDPLTEAFEVRSPTTGRR